LKELRKKQGLSLAAAAKILGTFAPNLLRKERGDEAISVEMARKMAGLYGVSVEDITGGPIK